MTPKENAQELYEQMFHVIPSQLMTVHKHDKAAIDCSLIAVRYIQSEHEKLNAYKNIIDEDENGKAITTESYWNDVNKSLKELE